MKLRNISFLTLIVSILFNTKIISSEMKHTNHSDYDLSLALALSLSLQDQSSNNNNNNNKTKKKQLYSHKNNMQKNKIKGYRIHQIPVMPQSGSDCGFHCIYNGATVYEHLINQITEQEMKHRLNDKNSFQLEAWRKQSKEKSNISGQTVDYLAKKCANLSNSSFSVIPSITQIKDIINPNITININNKTHKITLEIINKILLNNAIKKIRNTNNTVHIFFICNATYKITGTQTPSGKINLNQNSTDGHWIAIVAQNINQEIHYYFMDSAATTDANIGKTVAYLHELITKYPVT